MLRSEGAVEADDERVRVRFLVRVKVTVPLAYDMSLTATHVSHSLTVRQVMISLP